jgi:hypothetical protein
MTAVTVFVLAYSVHMMLAFGFIGYCIGRLVERRKRANPPAFKGTP